MKTTENRTKAPCKTQQPPKKQESSHKRHHVVTQLTPDDLMTEDCLRKSKTGTDGELFPALMNFAPKMLSALAGQVSATIDNVS